MSGEEQAAPLHGRASGSAPEGVPTSQSSAPFVSGCSTRTPSPVRSTDARVHAGEPSPAGERNPPAALARRPEPPPGLPWPRRRQVERPSPYPRRRRMVADSRAAPRTIGGFAPRPRRTSHQPRPPGTSSSARPSPRRRPPSTSRSSTGSRARQRRGRTPHRGQSWSPPPGAP